ncbi:unnamed protein product [Clonostachys rosea f. rosea IK726]|uniref:Endoplasmic reticulum lectin n=3 Tax=Bionectria ochroleuca TaxID=29856 RepID=A0A0B7JIG5_BIOOC|nr:unnamed protein product [Clonostachys rosea f. rosea IK726]
MRRLEIVLLASLQLCAARSRGFNVHEDLLTFPQYEVVYSDDKWISEKEAQALLNDNPASQPTISTDLAKSTPHQGQGADEQDVTERSYQIMKIPPHQYLCSIPVLQPTIPENQTAHELEKARAEEAQELSRATVNGWELLSDLGDSCLYFMSGWWSYKFCQNTEIVQFHAAAATGPNQPPQRDPQTAEFILGATPAIPSTSLQKSRKSTEANPLPAEVQVKGDQRYLVQKLEGGTICDLTGRARTIEVQYHCVPGLKQARISWIKEVTICAYLMVVNTPQLCQDVAFLPPQEAKAHPINCQLVLPEGANPPLLEGTKQNSQNTVPDIDEERTPANQQPLQPGASNKQGVVIGGVVVGARNLLSGADEAGQPPMKLNTPKNYFKGDELDTEALIDLIAQAASKANGGKVEMRTREDLERMEVDLKDVEEMRAEMERIAGDLGWRLEIVELPNENIRELRGYVDSVEEAEDESDDEDEKPVTKESDQSGKSKGNTPNRADKPRKKEEGSKEKFFKDEL